MNPPECHKGFIKRYTHPNTKKKHLSVKYVINY